MRQRIGKGWDARRGGSACQGLKDPGQATPGARRSSSATLATVLGLAAVLGAGFLTTACETSPSAPTEDPDNGAPPSASSPPLGLNARMARDEPGQMHPQVTELLGHLVSGGNSSQEAFFDPANVPPAFAGSERIRIWTDEHIAAWSAYLVEHDIALAPSVNMYEPAADQIAGWQRFVDHGVRIENILFGGEFYLRQWFEGDPGNGMLGQVRIDRRFDAEFPPHPEVRYYLDMLDDFLPAFREAFPGRRLFIVACTTREGGGPPQAYRRAWRDAVVAYAEANKALVDGFRFHIYVGEHQEELAQEEQIELLSAVEAQIDAFPLPLYVAEGGQRDAYWDAEGEARLRRYVRTLGHRLQARQDGSIQSFHVAFGTWNPTRFPRGHPYVLATTAGMMHAYDPERFTAGSEEVVLTPVGSWFVENWEEVFDP